MCRRVIWREHEAHLDRPASPARPITIASRPWRRWRDEQRVATLAHRWVSGSRPMVVVLINASRTRVSDFGVADTWAIGLHQNEQIAEMEVCS